ncbi:hypothetical protein DL764_003246 [Monosporascus ibericus]|uniref:Uncharacterized protein n=1 Tax=Monosporascus ibericus TaxID=155417 RepID=A0A4Q4TL70_9PEZI|nr:hypothetical protein DL764_003246 [Monosporascus ibericus]
MALGSGENEKESSSATSAKYQKRVYREATARDEDEVFASELEEVPTPMDRRHKSSDEVFRRLYKRVAPLGMPYEPLPSPLKKLAADEKAE